MSVEFLQTLSMVSYIAAGVLFLGAVALFFLLNVPKLIGDISGSTAKKAIEAIRQQNESTGNKAYKPSFVNVSRGRVTDKISPSGKLEQRSSGLSIGAQTEKLGTANLAATDAEATTVLNVSETSVLQSEEFGATTVLSENAAQADAVAAKITVDVELNYTSSAEIIE